MGGEKKAWIVAISAGVFLGGCNLFVPNLPTPPKMCILSAPNAQDERIRYVPWHLAIDLPSCGAGYDTSRIAVARSSQMLEYYSGVEWSDRLPLLLQSLMVRAFENSTRIMGVAPVSAGINPDYLLMVDIREFSAVTYKKPPHAKILLTAKLMNMKDRHILKSTFINEEAPLASHAPDDIVASFQAAINKALLEVVRWTLVIDDGESLTQTVEAQARAFLAEAR